MLMRKGGVAEGVKNAEFSGNTRFKVVKRGQFGAHFGPNRASLGAFEFILIESERECDPKTTTSTRVHFPSVRCNPSSNATDGS